MGRQVRMVPPDWEHPKDDDGRYKPLYDNDYETVAREYLDACLLWDKGEHPAQKNDEYATAGGFSFYWEWAGDPPDKNYYRPAWLEETRTHLQMYENTSEGTPISPAFATPEELACWLADNGASAFGSMTATYEEWLNTIKAGWAPGMLLTVREDGTGSAISGVAATPTPNPDPQ